MSAPARHRPPVFQPTIRRDLPELPPLDEWILDAACRGQIDKDDDGNDQWHPHAQQDTSLGKQFCKGCLVRTTCLAWALAHDIKWGTWGGVDQWQREELKKRNSS
jgi:WhiB family redox-sensing transcriptional regulator